MLFRVARLVLLLVLLNLGWFAFLLLAGRTLPAAEFGRLSLITSAVTLLVTLGDFGMTSTLLRWFASHPLADWNWPAAFVGWLRLSILAAATGGLLLVLAYHYPIGLGLVAALTALVQIAARALGAGLLKAAGRATLGILAEKGGRLLLPVAALLLAGQKVQSVDGWVLCWALCLCVTGLMALTLATKLPRGPRSLPLEFSSGSLFFWLMSAAYLASSTIDRLLIPKLLDYERLGHYAAVANLILGFDVLTTALAYLIVPRFGRRQDLHMVREAVLPLSLALCGFVLVVALGPWALRWIYGGKYDSAAALLAPLAAVAVLRVLYVVPSSVVATRFLRPQLSRLLVVYGVLLLAQFCLLFVFVPRWGLLGVVAASGAVALSRLLAVGVLASRRLSELRRGAVNAGAPA